MSVSFDSPNLAINGGTPVRTQPFPSWPVHDEAEVEAVKSVAASGKWWRCAYGTSELEQKSADQIEGRSRVEVFEERFAKAHGAKYAVAVTNGTAALEIAIQNFDANFVKTLTGAGSAVNVDLISNPDRGSPLFQAVIYGSHKITNILLLNGADIS